MLELKPEIAPFTEEEAFSLLKSSFCNVSFAIHPSFYHEEAVLGGFTSGPLKIAAKDFCLCKGCKLPALRVCLGEVEGGIHSHVYSSGLEVHFFVCDGCTALTSGDVRPKCACCDDGSGLLRKSTNGYWVHYTCALLTTKVKILSLADMKFEFKEEFDINKLEQKKTRSKKAQEGPGIHTVLRNQAQLIVAGEKEADDHDFTLIRFMLQSRDDRRPAEIEKKQLIENINSNIEFGAPLQNQKKTTKKKKVVTDAVNATVLLGIETKEEFLQQVEDHWKVESNHFIQNEVQDRYQLQILLPNDNGRSANYCNCFQTKEMENFISCDECQVWYHCGCVGVCLETLTANDSFICQKCKKFKELENKKPILFQDLEPLKKERLNFDEIINLGVLIESAIIESASPADIFAMDFSCFDISSIISTRLCDFALNCFLVSRTTALLQQINLTRVYKEGSIDSEEFIKLRTLVHGSRAVALSVSSTDKMPEYVSFNELLETIELGTQLYEELRARVLRLPILVSIAKKVESHPELRTLEAHQTFIAALKIAKSKLDLILADFREFSKSLDGKIKEDNVEGVQNCKLQNSRLAEYRKDLMDNHLALRVVEALLSDLGLSEADKHSEIPLKLDHFLVILKKELKSIFRSGESDVVRVWQEKRGLFEKSKVIMHKIQKLKTELPQWKEIAELDTPEAVVATRTEVDRILEESEDSVLVMNSAIVKKLSDLKVASIKFEKRNVGDHWNSSESSKRYVFNLIKSGVLFNDEAVKLVKELKLYGQIVRFCNNRGMFSIAEIEAQLATGERKFEKDFYIKADLLAEEIKVFLNKASQLQDRKDVWNDRVLEECLQVHKKLKDYRIKLPSTLNKFASICKSVNWLMDIAEQCGLETEIEKPGALLRYPFETTVQKLNLTDSLIDNLNIRTLVRLEKTHPPGVFLHHPNLFVLSSKTAKRVWQKDFEEVIAVGWPIHVEDFKHLLKKWAVMDPELSTVPKEMRILLDEYIEFRNSCQKLVHNEIDLFPLEMDKMEKTCVDLSRITGLNKVACLENTFDNLQRCAVMFLNFALKTQKVLLYTEQSTGGRKPAEGSQIESSEIVMLENLMNHVLKNIQREMPLELASQTWLSQFLHLAKIFSQKVQQGEKISALVEGLQKRSEVVLQRISALRKEKNISLGAIMEEIKGKPTVEEAKDILKKYQAFSSTVDDKRGLIERSIEDSYTLVETMNRLISETKISMSGDDENKTKFQSYEKEFLRLLKKSENLLVYSPTFTICIQAANTLYKIYKLYFEPATMKKWSKVNDSIKETFSQFQEVEEVVKKTGVLDSFTSQLSVISQLTDRLVKEKVSLEDVRAMEVLCDSCLVDKIGNVEIHKLLSDCQSLNSILDQVKEAGPSKKVGLDVMENCRLQIDNFDLVIDDQEVDFLLKAVDSHKSLLKFLQGAQKEGFLMNGFLTDFIEKRYTSSPIYSKPIEDLLTARQNALNQYDNVENTIKRLADDSYREAEAKLTSIKPTWEIRNKKLMLLAWLRKAKAIHDNKLPVNLVALECLVAEGAEFFERSKKLIPKDQRIISICLVNKIGYLEELLLMADAFLEDLSKSRSVGELDELKNKFKEHGRIDLSSTIIDMRTQLSFGSIEFTKQRRQANVPAIRDSIGQITTGEVGWDIDRDYRNVEELFNRLIQHDRNTLETRFIEMLDSGHFSLYREPFQLSLEGSLGNKDDQMLGKRKPVVKPNYSTHTASIPKNLALISKPGDEIAGPLVNTHSIANLSNLQVDLETITDSFRENVISNLFICLKENTHFETDHSILNNGAKNMEMHLFSEEHKSKSGYTKAYLFLRGLISRLSNYEAISRDLAKNSFNYDYIMQFREKSDQRLLAFERELKALVDSKYNPLGSLAKDTKIGATSRSQKPPGAAGKNRLLEVAGDKSLLSDVLQQLEAEEVAKPIKILKALAPKPQRADFKEKSTSPSKSRSPIQERSRSSSKGKRRYKRRRDDDSSEEKKVIKKKDKERKKKSHEKAKFSSESEGGGDEGEEEEERGARFSDDEGGFANSKIVGSSSPVVKKPSQPFKATSDSRPDASQPVMGNGIHKPLPGSWLNINYLKGKIRIFASDAKKNENQGYSVSCHLYTSEPEEVVHQFPDFSKVVTFVFDKYMKEADEIEMHYQRKIAQMKRSPIPPSSQTIIAGWMVPAEGESKDKEQHKLSYLESYLSKKPVSISYNPTAGLTVWVVMGKWLKNETLKAIGIKDKYDSDRTIKLDKQIIFFLRRNIEKEDPNSKKLTSRVVQAYDKQKEASLKYVFGTRTENPNEEKHKDTKRQGESNTQKSVGEGQVQKGTEQPVLDQSMREMLVLLRELSTQEAKEFFESITDKNLKQKLRNIITEHLPDLLAVITEQQALDSDRISSMGRPPLPMPSMQPPFYPHAPHLGAPQMKPIQGHPPQGFMGYDPTKMMQMAPLPHQPQPQPSAGQMGGMPYRQPPSLPMNPFMNKPPPMMMPLRPTPGMGAPPGQLNPQPGPMGAPPGQGLMGPPQANLPTATMNTPVGGNHGGGMGYSPLTINPQLGGQQNPPQMMYPNMMPMGGPGSYQMMGVPYIYSMPPPQMKPPMMPGQSMNPENDRKMQGQQLPK